MGTPDAMAISSTTLSNLRSSGSVVFEFTNRPPIDSATMLPPPASWLILNALPIETIASVIRDAPRKTCGFQNTGGVCS